MRLLWNMLIVLLKFLSYFVMTILAAAGAIWLALQFPRTAEALWWIIFSCLSFVVLVSWILIALDRMEYIRRKSNDRR